MTDNSARDEAERRFGKVPLPGVAPYDEVESFVAGSEWREQVAPTLVEIVRPKRDAADFVEFWSYEAAAVFIGAWVLMLLLPFWSPWNLSYWQAVALVWTVRMATPNVDGIHFFITRRRK